MDHLSKTNFCPLCDLHHCPMRHVMLEDRHRRKPDLFTSANGAIVIASSAMGTAIPILPTVSSMHRACLPGYVPSVGERSTLRKWNTR